VDGPLETTYYQLSFAKYVKFDLRGRLVNEMSVVCKTRTLTPLGRVLLVNLILTQSKNAELLVETECS
jgi:hypothetical protein